MIFLLCNNLFIYQVLCTLIYRRRSLYSFLFGELRVWPFVAVRVACNIEWYWTVLYRASSINGEVISPNVGLAFVCTRDLLCKINSLIIFAHGYRQYCGLRVDRRKCSRHILRQCSFNRSHRLSNVQYFWTISTVYERSLLSGPCVTSLCAYRPTPDGRQYCTVWYRR